MYPQQAGFDGEREERMPPNKLAIDLIWRSFLRMFVGEGDAEPTGPNVKVVNLSLGDLNRRFSGVLSPWARLIDYLSWKYGVLVLVSAGNIPDPIPLEGVAAWADFEAASAEERETILLRAILRQRATRRLLSPSEGMNALTVGACHADAIEPNGSGPMALDPYETECLPNPSSALGLGYLRGVKPEILLPGGREHVRTTSNQAPMSVYPVKQPGRFFGIGVAAPGPSGEVTRKLNSSGTSVATALATHSALKVLEALDEIPAEPPILASMKPFMPYSQKHCWFMRQNGMMAWRQKSWKFRRKSGILTGNTSGRTPLGSWGSEWSISARSSTVLSGARP